MSSCPFEELACGSIIADGARLPPSAEALSSADACILSRYASVFRQWPQVAASVFRVVFDPTGSRAPHAATLARMTK